MFRNYFKEILLGVILVLIIGLYGLCFYYYFYLFEESSKDDGSLTYENVISSSSEETNTEDKLYVELKGAVVSPGVYEVTSANIINDVINMAGGFNANAYTYNINLSRKVLNEMVINVYTKYEYSKINQKETEIVYVEKECSCPSYDLSSCLNTGASVIVDGENQKIESEENNLININTASKETLMTLSGIGEAKAENIINYRENNAFQTIEDIKNVSGISDALYEKIKDYITV